MKKKLLYLIINIICLNIFFDISDWFGYDISETSRKDWFKKKENIYQKLMIIPGLGTKNMLLYI